ncbi:MAG: GNAT family N-acetyltransferase, partial [Anaerolineae bacterium]
MDDKKSHNKQAIQAERRRLLIDATMSAISEHGLSQLTLAKIASEVGLSAGSVNFHFASKEALLLATLTSIAQEFEEQVLRAVTDSDHQAAARLQALIEAAIDQQVTEPRKMAVWYAFTSEARLREDYKRICGARERKIFELTLRLCTDVIREGGKSTQMNARAMANAIQGLIDEIWEEILYEGETFNREDARYMYLSFLASVFPWAYQHPPRPGTRPAPTAVAISEAGAGDLAELARLFDLYRQFYQQPPDGRLARRFLQHNLDQQRSTVYVARNPEGAMVGFVQLYPGWCSVAAAPTCILYDLYVDAASRQGGVGRALMLRAEQ